MQEDYERQIKAIDEVIRNLHKEKAELENKVNTENSFLASFRKYENIDKLTRGVLIELVEQIKVYGNGNIRVHLKFANESAGQQNTLKSIFAFRVELQSFH